VTTFRFIYIEPAIRLTLDVCLHNDRGKNVENAQLSDQKCV